MVSLLLILLLLVLLFLFHLLIMLIENNEIKTELASENLDKGKSILGDPLSLRRKMLKTLGLKRLTLKSLNRRSNISVIIMELLVILDQIAISG